MTETAAERNKRREAVENIIKARHGTPKHFVWASSMGPMIIAAELRRRRSNVDSWYGSRRTHTENITIPQNVIRWLVTQPKWVKKGVDLYNTVGPRPASVEECGGFTAMRQAYNTADGYPYEHQSAICWVSEKPKFYKRNSNRQFHCENGPAIAWEDGFELYFINNVVVPKNLVMNPDQVKVEDVLTQRNAEVLRLMLAKMSPEKFVKNSGAKILDKDEVPSTTLVPSAKAKGKMEAKSFVDKRSLLEIPTPNLPDKKAVMVYLECPSTGHKTLIGVPPRFNNVKAAVEWIEDINPNTHELVYQT